EEEGAEGGGGEGGLKWGAAGVWLADVLMGQGIHPEARRPPFTPGWDVVGTVDVLGEGVEAVPLGATVAAMPIIGGYAEYLCLPQEELVPLPPQVSPPHPLSLPPNYFPASHILP